MESVEDMMEILKKLGSPVKYIVNQGIGHWYPEDLDDKIDQALQYILG